jgi:hypothetical protein
MEICRAFLVLCILLKFIREGWHLLQFLKASSVKTTRVHVINIMYLDCHTWYLHNLFNHTIRKDSLVILHNIYYAIQPHKIIFGIATLIDKKFLRRTTFLNSIEQSKLVHVIRAELYFGIHMYTFFFQSGSGCFSFIFVSYSFSYSFHIQKHIYLSVSNRIERKTFVSQRKQYDRHAKRRGSCRTWETTQSRITAGCF